MIPVIGRLKYVTIKVFREFLKAKKHYVATLQMPSGDVMDATCREARDPCTSPGWLLSSLLQHSCCLQIALFCQAAQRAAARNGTRNHAQALRKLLVLAKGRTGRGDEEGLKEGRTMGMWNRATFLIKTSHASKHIKSVFWNSRGADAFLIRVNQGELPPYKQPQRLF